MYHPAMTKRKTNAKLIELVRRHGLSPATMSKALRTHRSTVYYWLSGTYPVSTKFLASLTDYLRHWEPGLRERDLL